MTQFLGAVGLLLRRREPVVRRILWRNVPGRFWLWWHRSHAYKRLWGSVWTCSCGSWHRPAEPNRWA